MYEKLLKQHLESRKPINVRYNHYYHHLIILILELSALMSLLLLRAAGNG